MKHFFTLLAFICSIFINQNAISQCNYSSGSNGVSAGLSTPITIDGNMSDWTTYLSDPDNNSYDNTGGIDLDGSISDIGRNLTRFGFTEDASYLYIYLQRAGSANNSADIIFYADINDNGLMDSREPVVHLSWNGANGNVSIAIRDYQPSLLGGLVNSITSNLDGSMLQGTISSARASAGSASGQGAPDGVSLEAKIPFSVLTQLNSLGAVINQLIPGQNFKFHVSTINGNVYSVPGLNSINDNFGGCLIAPPVFIALPIKLLSFQGSLTNNKVQLQWSVAENETANYFEVQKSVDGKNFTNIGLVFTGEEARTEYAFKEGSELGGTSYYRLKIINKNGSVVYSKIVVLKNENAIAAKSLVVLRNQGPSVTFNYTASKAGVYKINIYSMSGAKLFASGISMQPGFNAASLKVDGLISSGVYILEVVNGTDRNSTKFVK